MSLNRSRHATRLLSEITPLLSLTCPQIRFSSTSVARPANKTVLAIETSCDDTAVAIVQYDSRSLKRGSAKALFHKRITANNDLYAGIHPLAALHSHRIHLAPLVQEALDHVRSASTSQSIRSSPDFVAVTRGPGMRSNLSTGLDMAKGLATAWGVPLMGVHHMQAHALTPRLIAAMDKNPASYATTNTAVTSIEPAFPFLTVLVSGGHTLLIDSTDLTRHRILAETQDIALGDCLDKAARAIVPSDLLRPPFGGALERFAFHSRIRDEEGSEILNTGGLGGDSQANEVVTDADCSYDYVAPVDRQAERARRSTEWGWSIGPPLSQYKGHKGGADRKNHMAYSFSGILSQIERIATRGVSHPGDSDSDDHQQGSTPITLQERRQMAREIQRVAFEHLASRIVMHLSSKGREWKGDTIVVSGGVASNRFLRHVLRTTLDARGFKYIKLSFPPIELCTDNALMIAWAGIEMYEAGYRSTFDIGPLRKWSMDPQSEDGGILGVGGMHQQLPQKA